MIKSLFILPAKVNAMGVLMFATVPQKRMLNNLCAKTKPKHAGINACQNMAKKMFWNSIFRKYVRDISRKTNISYHLLHTLTNVLVSGGKTFCLRTKQMILLSEMWSCCPFIDYVIKILTKTFTQKRHDRAYCWLYLLESIIFIFSFYLLI